MHLMARPKQTLPSCHGIGADYWMGGCEIEPFVIGGAALGVQQLKLVLCGHFVEIGLLEFGLISIMLGC